MEEAMRSERRNTTRLAQLALIGLCVALVGCGQPQPPRPVGSSASGKTEKGLKGVEIVLTPGSPPQAKPTLALKVSEPKPATSIVKAPPVPQQPPPRPGSPAVVSVRAVSAVPYPSEAEAEEDALARACELVTQELAKLDPPVHYQPSLGEVKEKYLRKDTRATRPPTDAQKEILASLGDTRNFVSVEYVVEVTAEQVREIRSRDRVLFALRVLGGLSTLALAGFLFLRADEWTKGYLTSWLALAAVTLAGGAAAALLFI
jgi:hypothetical protein